MPRFPLLLTPVLLALTAFSARAAPCPHSSVQARVQSTVEDPWKSLMTISLGETFRVGGFKNGSGVFAERGTVEMSIVNTSWNVDQQTVQSGQTVKPSRAGQYLLTVRCGDRVEKATVTVANCTGEDWDLGVSSVLPSQTFQPYRNESGWQGFAWPVANRRKCELPLGDLHLYWTHPFAADPANKLRVRLRYFGANADCARAVAERGGAADYKSDAVGVNNVHVVGRGPYVRVVLSGRCIAEAAQFALVWP